LAIDPDIAAIQLNLGLAEFKSGAFREAIAPFQSAVRLDPKNFQAVTMLGMAYFGARMYPEAADTLELSVGQQPDNVQLRFNLTQSLVFSSQFERALKQFDALRQLAPTSSAVHVLLAEAYDGLSRSEEAIAELKAAIAQAPSEPNLHFALGYMYWVQHKDDEAEREFKIEAERDPKNAQPLAWLGSIQIRRNELQKAKVLLEKAIALDRDLRIAHVDLGIVFAETGQNNRAIAEWKEAIRLDPEQVDAHYRLARLYRATGRVADANRELEIVKGLKEKKDTLANVTKKPVFNATVP
jgi:tetratricopeptide (TPR) repeat protein